MAEATVPTVDNLLEASAATPEFRSAVERLSAEHAPNDRVRFAGGNPPVKVLRVICGLLEQFPQVRVDSVEVQGRSGCSDYRGTLSINGGEKKFRFAWDCAWRAEQEGWRDYFGNPDQIRAARTFGYRCFKTFEEA